jgi:hypothetical protein
MLHTEDAATPLDALRVEVGDAGGVRLLAGETVLWERAPEIAEEVLLPSLWQTQLDNFVAKANDVLSDHGLAVSVADEAASSNDQPQQAGTALSIVATPAEGEPASEPIVVGEVTNVGGLPVLQTAAGAIRLDRAVVDPTFDEGGKILSVSIIDTGSGGDGEQVRFEVRVGGQVEEETQVNAEQHAPIPVESLFKYHTAWPKILDAIGAETGVKVEFFAAPSSHAVHGDEIGFFPWDAEAGVQSQETRPDLLADLIYSWFETIVTKANPDGSFWAMNANQIQQWIEEGGRGGVTARDGRAPNRSELLNQHNVQDVTRIMLVHQGFEKPASGQRQPVEAGSVPLDATGSDGKQLFIRLPINAGEDFNIGFQLLEVAVFPNEDKGNTGKTLVVFYNGMISDKIADFAQPEIGWTGGSVGDFFRDLLGGFVIASQTPDNQKLLTSLQRGALRELKGLGFASRGEAMDSLSGPYTSPYYQNIAYEDNQPPMVQIRPVGYP